MIYLGCSGWSYPDWVGPFYPSTKTPKLNYYMGIFNTVEINTTFYSVPKIGMFNRWIKSVSERNFKYSIKFPGEVTHRQLMEDVDFAVKIAEEFERNYIRVMHEARRLAAVLLQLPPYFTIKNMHRLLSLLSALSTSEIKYFIEPRHETLYASEEFRESIHEKGAEVIEIDGPELQLTEIRSQGKAFYTRLHGRNYALWNVKTENPSDRYNYEYSDSEIKVFSEIIKRNIPAYEDAFIYFNNHPQGKAARNAISMSALLGLGNNEPQKKLI